MLQIRDVQEVCIYPAGALKKEPKLLLPLAYNLDDTAKVTGLSKRTIRRFVKRGLLCPSKASRRLIFARSEIERFLKDTTFTEI